MKVERRFHRGVLLYMSGDNNLKPYMRRQYEKFKRELSLLKSDEVGVAGEIDAGETYRFISREDEIAEFRAEEADMISPEHLKDFLRWATKEIPAERYVLVVSSHGSYSGDVIKDTTSPSILETIKRKLKLERSMMPLKKFSYALLDTQLELVNRGAMIDAVVFDACSMASARVLYELSGVVPVVIASPETIGAYGLRLAGLVRAAEGGVSQIPLSQSGNPYVSSMLAVDTSTFKEVMNKLSVFLNKVALSAEDRERLRRVNDKLRREALTNRDANGEPLKGITISRFISELKSAFPEYRDELREIEKLYEHSIISKIGDTDVVIRLSSTGDIIPQSLLS